MLGKLAEEKEKEAANVDRIRMLSNSPSFRRRCSLKPLRPTRMQGSYWLNWFQAGSGILQRNRCCHPSGVAWFHLMFFFDFVRLSNRINELLS
jgi:hypothetical protein